MTANFIKRPVLSIVISLIITILGVLALFQLPMTQFPSIAPPEVNVTVDYTGANAETVTKTAIIPLERAINGVPGMKYINSRSGNDGVGIIQIIFETGTDPDIAGVNVQNRVATVIDELPAEVIKSGVKVGKVENSLLMYLDIYSEDESINEKFLYNYADINVLSELKRIKGIGYIDILGAKDYAMRIWLKPDKMLSYNISTQEVNNALQEQNIESAPGKLGENSDRTNYPMQYVVNYTGKFNKKEQYENIPIKATETGQILRLKDIAEVEFGTNYFDVESKFNGQPSASIVIKQAPGSNAQEVIEEIKEKMSELKKETFIKGMNYSVSYDVSRFLDASIHEVVKTLIEAFILVSLVVFLFLQDFKSTLIPAITVPVSLVGTFFFMSLMGFSLNLVTLFALVLAIGIVVDNAIVVVEAVHAKMENSHISAKKATEMAMKEITGAIIAITLVMSAVFIPVAFMSGPTGVFYRQFSLTMAISIVLSGVIALTLTPALCALLLKNHNHETKSKSNFLSKFFGGFNKWYNNVENRYANLLKAIISRKVVTFSILFFFLFSTGILGKIIPTGFIPNEDQGSFYVNVTSPSGATLERTKEVTNQIQRIIQKIDAVENVGTISGANILSDGTGASFGTVVVNLKQWSERDKSVDDVIKELQEKTKHIKSARIEMFPPPTVPGYGNSSGFELKLLDKSKIRDIKTIDHDTKNFIKELEKRPEIGMIFTTFDASFPQYILHIDQDKAAQKGVTINNALSSLQTLLGSEYVTNFIRFGQMYRVMVQALPEYRSKPEDLMNLYVKNNKDEMVSIGAFMRVEKTSGLEQLARYNMYTTAEIFGEQDEGYSSGDAIKAIQEVASNKLPKGYGIDWGGISKDEQESGNASTYIFIMCLVFVYLLLSAQYESFLLPLPVILSLPTGIFGAFFFLWLLGLENNIYAQVSMIMLIGLLGKNAILIIEFAVLKHREGMSVFDAALEGARLRLRPILMTSFAFIAGLIPLMMASGAGALGNRTIGSAAAGGMLIGTLFGVILIPGLYYFFGKLEERMKLRKGKEQKPYTETL